MCKQQFAYHPVHLCSLISLFSGTYGRYNSEFSVDTGRITRYISPVENKNDLELDFKVFSFTDSCCSYIVHDESN